MGKGRLGNNHLRIRTLASCFICSLLLFVYGTVFVSGAAVDCSVGKHDYTVTVQAATQEKDGEKRSVCKRCGYTVVRTIPATGHTWSDWLPSKPATCTTPGTVYRYCTRHSNDSHRQKKTVLATGHDYQERIIGSTCEQDGWKRYTCLHCGDTYKEANGTAIGHSYIEEMTKQPTCEEAGEKTMTCSRCGDWYTEPISSRGGHDYVQTVTIDPDCERAGEVTSACVLCGDTETEELPSLGHSYGEWTDQTKEGYRYRVCGHNSAHREEEPLPRQGVNVWDVVFLSSAAVAATGFGAGIYSEYTVLRWDRKKSISWNDWVGKQ